MTELVGGNSCANCKFAKTQLSEMICRRFPPSAHPVMAMTPQGPQVIGKVALQPPIQSGMWCGEHVRKLEEAA